MLKDDNLGLGARRNQGDECTGLDALQELLGRLNGKGEGELAQERRIREDARVNKYLHRKLGTVRFVHGGFLVGDKVQELADELQREKEAKAEVEASGVKEGKQDKKNKKRMLEEEEDDGMTSEKKKEKKSKKRKTEDAEDESKSKRKEKKEKKRKDKEPTSEATTESESRNDEEYNAVDADETTSSRKKSKKDKKEKRRKSRDGDDANPEDGSDSQSKKKKKKRKAEKEDTDSSASLALATAASSTPSASGTSTPVSQVPHRHLARKRFIAQKRAAVMDPAALNQVRPSPLYVTNSPSFLLTLAKIFMIKA